MTTQLLVADGVCGFDGANAVLVDGDGAVAAVGSHRDLAADRVLTFPGGFLLPGLRDAHLHPVPYAALLDGCSLKTARDMAEVTRRLREAAGPSGKPVIALRLDDETLRERRLPSRDDLDAAVGDRPVLVHRYCGHVAVANSAALAAAGWDDSVPDPEGGIIDRDQAGRLTGVLREAAIEPVARALAGSAAVTPAQVRAALDGLATLGITSIGAIVRVGDGPWASLGNEAALVASMGVPPIRVHGLVSANTVADLDEGRRMLGSGTPRLRWLGLKRYADGSLGGRTAAMDEPFADDPSQGTLRLGPTDDRLVRHCGALGGVVAIHAIGDRACRAAIDLIESARLSDARIEHASVLAPGDAARMAAAGIIGCVQPAFLGSEGDWLEDRVGTDRLGRTYPFRTMLEAGVVLAAGSDAPVEPPDPWSGMALARDRNGIVSGEGLTARQALALFTDGAARALREPAPLTVGAPADVIVVDRNPLLVDADVLRGTLVEAVWVGGQAVELKADAVTWPE